MSSISARVLKGSFWVTLTRLFTNGLAVLSTFILAWNLSPGDFGIVAIGTTILAILSSLTEFSLSQALVQLEAPDETHLSAAWTLNALRGVALCIIVCGSAWPVAYIFADDRLKGIMIALGICLFIDGLANPKLAIAQRSLEYWQYFAVSTGQKLIGFVTAVAVAVIYKSYWALIVGSLATQLANVTLSYVAMPFRPRVLFRYFREFFGFSGWLMGAQLVTTLNWRFDELLVGKLFGPTTLGYYTMGGNLAQMPTRETTAPLTQPLFPTFNLLKHDPPRLRAAYERVQSLVTAVALPAGVGTAVIAGPLVRFALGEKWLTAVSVVEVLAAVFALQTLGSLAHPLGMALGQTRILFFRDFLLFVVRVPLVLAGALIGGLPGVLIARVVAGAFSIVMNHVLVRQFIKISVIGQLAANFRTLFSTAIMAAVLWRVSPLVPATSLKAMQGLQVLMLAGAGAAIYTSCMIALWAISGRPSGPETEIAKILQKIGSRLKPAFERGTL